MVEAVNAIELKNITKRFGEKVIANDSVNLTVRKGEILSLLGENGSGKTTLMNMLSGIYFPDEGQIFVNGKEVMISSPKDAFDLGIGMIHQHFKLIEVLTSRTFRHWLISMDLNWIAGRRFTRCPYQRSRLLKS